MKTTLRHYFAIIVVALLFFSIFTSLPTLAQILLKPEYQFLPTSQLFDEANSLIDIK